MPETIKIYQDVSGIQDVIFNFEDVAPFDFYRLDQGFQIGTTLTVIGGGVYPYRIWTVLRFKIPFTLDDREILEARFVTTAISNTGNVDLIRTTIALEDVDDADIPISRAVGVAAVLTTAQVNWDPSSQLPLPPTAFIISDDIKAPLIEVLQRPGWLQDNYICIYFMTTAPTPGITSINLFVGHAQSTITTETQQAWPRLEITYNLLTGVDENVEHEIDVEQSVHGYNTNLKVFHDITVEEDIDYANAKIREYYDDIIVTQIIHVPFSKVFPVQDILIIAQEINSDSGFAVSVEHSITIYEDIIRNSEFDKQIVQEFPINQDIEYDIGHIREVIDELTIEEDIFANNKQFTIVQSLTVSQDIDVEAILQPHFDVVDELTIEQDVDRNIVYAARGVEHELTVEQIIIGYLLGDDCSRFDVNYNAFVSKDVEFSAKPNLVQTYTLKLEYPFTTPTNTVILRPPLFGNREELQVTRIQRRTVDSDLKTFIDENWPKIRTFKYQFEGINDALLTDFNDFVLLSLGLEVKLTDHEGRRWKGFIVTPDLEQADLSNDECHNTLGFEFVCVEFNDLPNVDEGIISGNIFNAIKTTNSSGPEGGKSGDTFSSGVNYASNINEGMKSGDTNLSGLSLGSNVTEGAKSGDTFTSSVGTVYNESVSEGALSGDSYISESPITVIQTDANNDQDVSSITGTLGTVTEGNLIVVACKGYGSYGFEQNDCTQTGSAVLSDFILDGSMTVTVEGETCFVGIWSAVVLTSGSLSILVDTGTTGLDLCIGILEASGNWDNRLEGANNVSGGPDNEVNINDITTGGEALCINAFATITPDLSSDPNSPWTEISTVESGAPTMGSAYKIVSVSTTVSIQWTLGGETPLYATSLVAYKQG